MHVRVETEKCNCGGRAVEQISSARNSKESKKLLARKKILQDLH